MKPGLHFDVPQDVYHSDPLPDPSLSASIAHTLVSRSPFHAWLQHPRLGGQSKPPTKSMDLGTVGHAIVLGTGKDYAVITGFDDWRKSAAQALRNEAREAGKVPMLEKDFDAANALAGKVAAELKKFGIELSGASEVVAVWEEETTDGQVVRCRGCMDHVIVDDGVIYDLKFVRSAHPRACQSHIYGFGGDIQSTAYERALVKHRPELAGRTSFVFLFCEVSTAIVTPISLAGSMREVGRARWERAVKLWAECTASNRWPAYVDRLTQVEAPGWAMSAEIDAEDSEDWTHYSAPDGPSVGAPRPQTGEQHGEYERDIF